MKNLRFKLWNYRFEEKNKFDALSLLSDDLTLKSLKIEK